MSYRLVLFGLLTMFVITGCTDKLGMVDFSGRVDLEPDSNGWAYRNIASSSVRPVRVDPEDRLGDYQKDLELQKAIAIGKGQYMIATRFKTDRPSTGHEILDYLLKTDRFTVYGDYQIVIYDFDGKERVETVVAKDSETGEPWDSVIDDLKSNFKTRILERRGEFVQYFREPGTQKDCIIEITYQIKSDVTRSIDKNGKFIKENDEYKYDNLSVTGSAQINLGFRQCLSGWRVVGDRSIRFYLLDWNLDGEFTEDDVVWSDYTSKTYQFGQTVRLTDSWVAKKDNTYRLKLLKPKSDSEKYQLEIELVAKGKR